MKLHRQTGGTLGLVEPLNAAEIKLLKAALGATINHRTVARINLHIQRYVSDVLNVDSGQYQERVKFLAKAAEDPVALFAAGHPAPADRREATMEPERATLAWAWSIKAGEQPNIETAAIAFFRVQQIAKRRLGELKKGRGKANVPWKDLMRGIVREVTFIGMPDTLPQHHDESSTTPLSRFAEAVSAIAHGRLTEISRTDQSLSVSAHKNLYRRISKNKARSTFLQGLAEARSEIRIALSDYKCK